MNVESFFMINKMECPRHLSIIITTILININQENEMKNYFNKIKFIFIFVIYTFKIEFISILFHFILF